MSFVDIIYCLAIVGFIFVVLLSLYFEKKAGISPTPVMPWVRRRALSLLKEHRQLLDIRTIADLGSGWGGMIGQLQKQYPTAYITGYEISPCPYYFTRLRFMCARDKITIKRHDFFSEDIAGYDVVFCYLSPQHMEKLKPHLSRLKKGSLVVTCSFPIEGWEPIATVTVWGLVKIPICLYRI